MTFDERAVLQALLAPRPSAPAFLLATVDPGYSSSGPLRLVFDGETSPTVRAWPRLASYTPAANDRVLVALVGASGVVLGKVV